jgi:hypothetical protein
MDVYSVWTPSHFNVKAMRRYVVRMQGGIVCSASAIGVIAIVRFRTNQWFGGRKLNCISWLELGKNSIKTDSACIMKRFFIFTSWWPKKQHFSTNGLPFQSSLKLLHMIRDEDYCTCSLLVVYCDIPVRVLFRLINNWLWQQDEIFTAANMVPNPLL